MVVDRVQSDACSARLIPEHDRHTLATRLSPIEYWILKPIMRLGRDLELDLPLAPSSRPHAGQPGTFVDSSFLITGHLSLSRIAWRTSSHHAYLRSQEKSVAMTPLLFDCSIQFNPTELFLATQYSVVIYTNIAAAGILFYGTFGGLGFCKSVMLPSLFLRVGSS